MAKPDHNIFQDTIWAGKKIGLLGGSFNPAHQGHLDISLSALRTLKLDAVWWLVSPQNPLKSCDDMASLQERMVHAKKIAKDKRIHVTDLENDLGTRYTIDTLGKIIKTLPETEFIWLMGADNIVQFSQWKDWKKIAQIVLFAIFDRPSYSMAVETSEAAQYFKDYQIPENKASEFASMHPPAWIFIRDIQNPLSSTEIRRKIL
ncbi:MAG: nicotinate-nucleotide adenylyltransferase [Emcibacter sp.]|nr:nicotinate-nucleotide adenylyltransferase [Emcibacter sp.]